MTEEIGGADQIFIFDGAQISRARARAAVSGHDGFLRKRVDRDFSERLRDIKKTFSSRRAIERADFDENDVLRIEPQSYDLILCPPFLHAVNDLPGAMTQIRRALKPDGLFIGALFGGKTLYELRESLIEAEMSVCGGISPRVAPMAGRQDMAALMQRAGFALPVVDADILTATYSDIFRLMADLRSMGETNALTARRKSFSRRGLFMEAGHRYREKFGDGEGRISATFEIIYLTGWAPHETQQKPLPRGSARKSLADVL